MPCHASPVSFVLAASRPTPRLIQGLSCHRSSSGRVPHLHPSPVCRLRRPSMTRRSIHTPRLAGPCPRLPHAFRPAVSRHSAPLSTCLSCHLCTTAPFHAFCAAPTRCHVLSHSSVPSIPCPHLVPAVPRPSCMCLAHALVPCLRHAPPRALLMRAAHLHASQAFSTRSGQYLCAQALPDTLQL